MQPDLVQWRDYAACRDYPTSLFFPIEIKDSAAAKAICATCVCCLACREYAVATKQEFGVWGGMDEKERRRMEWRERAV